MAPRKKMSRSRGSEVERKREACDTVGDVSAAPAKMDNEKGPQVFVDKRSAFSAAGSVKTATIFVGTGAQDGSRSLGFGVFRAVEGSDCEFTLVANKAFKVNMEQEEDTRTFQLDLSVETGDFFGFYYGRYNPIGYNKADGSDNYCYGKVKISGEAGQAVALSANADVAAREYALQYEFCPQD